MLNRRDKRRYVAIWDGDRHYNRTRLMEVISKRSRELFGHIATEKARLRFIADTEDGQIKILSCKLELLTTVLSIVGLLQPPIVLLRISGTLKALRRELNKNSWKFKCALT
jgi:RNase P/RNase MRP subunit POP5